MWLIWIVMAASAAATVWAAVRGNNPWTLVVLAPLFAGLILLMVRVSVPTSETTSTACGSAFEPKSDEVYQIIDEVLVLNIQLQCDAKRSRNFGMAIALFALTIPAALAATVAGGRRRSLSSSST